ncbi:MAG: type IV pilus secretin PilQ [Gammaproteobacteria bacterium]|nr:type IV pilus secretin PilQ [Gammaproteobacteria bacterium]
MNSKIIFKQFLLAVLWGISISAVSAVHASNMLEDISFSSIPGDKVQVVLQFSESAPEPGTFTIDTPARIALDFPGTGVALEQKRQTIGIGLARSVTAVAAGGRTRVVLNMVALTKYSTEAQGNKLVITLDEANVSRSTASLGRNVIKDIDFRLGDDAEGNIIISFAEQPKNVNLKQEFEKLVVEIENVGLPGDLERRLDVNDFNTPVSFIDTFASGKNIKMKIDTKGEFEHLGYQAGKTFTIEVKGLTKAQKEAREKAKFGYSGERLSLNFQDIEVRAVLQLIADFTGKNMVTSDTVSGSITLRLKNVPWDQALAIILKTKGLGMREEGNVMRVAPAEELAAIEKQELEAKKQIADLLPLVTETIQLQFVPALAVIALLDDMGANEANKNQASKTSSDADTAEDDEEGASYISSRATIVGDGRTNKLIVRDTARNIAQLRKLLKEIDTPTRQVLIDARVVSAGDKFAKDLGLNWNVNSTNSAGEIKERGQNVPGAVSPQTTDATVNLGAIQKNLLGVTFGLLNSSYLVDLEISASQSDGTSELISSPRVVTTNGTPAKIESGREIPYQTISDEGVSTAFKKAVLSLEVTPLIIPGKKVHMDLKINKDEVDAVVPTGIGSAPSINTKNIETSVLVDNGDTVVLGGIFERDVARTKDSVPVLGDIPVIGAAFRVNSTSDEKSELIIFITPKVMDETLSVR